MSSSRTANHDGSLERAQRALALIYVKAIERYRQAEAANENGGEESVRKEKYVSRNQTTQ
jgi:hypothetical protein